MWSYRYGARLDINCKGTWENAGRKPLLKNSKCWRSNGQNKWGKSADRQKRWCAANEASVGVRCELELCALCSGWVMNTNPLFVWARSAAVKYCWNKTQKSWSGDSDLAQIWGVEMHGALRPTAVVDVIKSAASIICKMCTRGCVTFLGNLSTNKWVYPNTVISAWGVCSTFGICSTWEDF